MDYYNTLAAESFLFVLKDASDTHLTTSSKARDQQIRPQHP